MLLLASCPRSFVYIYLWGCKSGQGCGQDRRSGRLSWFESDAFNLLEGLLLLIYLSQLYKLINFPILPLHPRLGSPSSLSTLHGPPARPLSFFLSSVRQEHLSVFLIVLLLLLLLIVFLISLHLLIFLLLSLSGFVQREIDSV